MPTPLFIVDAFTAAPFAGNPAAVCLLDSPASADWMQRVAAEMNLSETAFLQPRPDGFSLRWFTPKIEVELCGHATLASAHILWETKQVSRSDEVRLHTASGLLTCRRDHEWIEMNFPVEAAAPAPAPPELIEALQIEPRAICRNRFDFLLEIESESHLRSLTPDFRRLAAISTRGIIVTAPSYSPAFDFVSRFFAPAAGIDEDPVTGSAHCALAPYWAKRLGRTELLACQVSKRGGLLRLRLEGDRVFIAGQAVTVVRGQLEPPPALR